MGRPVSKNPLSKRLVVRVTPEQFAVLADYAKKNKQNVADVVRPQVLRVVDAIETMKAA